MLAKNDLKGRLFRNKKMTYDFYVTEVNEEGAIGLWISRGYKMLISTKTDIIKFSTVIPSDWKEVILDGNS